VSSEFARVRLSQELEQILRGMMTPRIFPKGATLFRQGSAADGIYLVEQGAVRVMLPTADNKNQLLEILGSGALLGLGDTMGSNFYRVTVIAEDHTTASFLDRQTFLQFLSSHHDFCMQVVRLLSDNLHGLYHKFRSVSAHPGRPRRRSLNEQLS